METDTYQHVSSALHVIRTLTTAQTPSNPESSRAGFFYEIQIQDRTIHKAKIHACFVDHVRVTNLKREERSFNIFYQMLAGNANDHLISSLIFFIFLLCYSVIFIKPLNPFPPFLGLTSEEKRKFHLADRLPTNLKYLNAGLAYSYSEEKEDARRFQLWRSCLNVLGISFSDVTRILAAILLLGEIKFITGNSPASIEVQGRRELEHIAELLGLAPATLHQGLASRSLQVSGQVFNTTVSPNDANRTKDKLARTLYCRMLKSVIRRANGGGPAAKSARTGSQDDTPTNTMTRKSAKNDSASASSELFIGIVDMFGFETNPPPKPSAPHQHARSPSNNLEQFCINLSAEMMQDFYTCQVLKTPINSYKEEFQTDHAGTHVSFAENTACLPTLTRVPLNLVSLLDAESQSPVSYDEAVLDRIRALHEDKPGLFFPHDKKTAFGVRHYRGEVEYETAAILETNKDALPDDVAHMFQADNCRFGFASHLFNHEIKASRDRGPQGLEFRIHPGHSGSTPASINGTLAKDFLQRVDSLLATLEFSKPHFVRCIKANTECVAGWFDKSLVRHQLRAMQIPQTQFLMQNGLAHRLRLKDFIHRYRRLLPLDWRRSDDADGALEACQELLTVLNQCVCSDFPMWAIGRRHLFLSERLRHLVEELLEVRRYHAAKTIQRFFARHCPFVKGRLSPAFSTDRESELGACVGSNAAGSSSKKPALAPGELPLFSPPLTPKIDLERNLSTLSNLHLLARSGRDSPQLLPPPPMIPNNPRPPPPAFARDRTFTKNDDLPDLTEISEVSEVESPSVVNEPCLVRHSSTERTLMAPREAEGAGAVPPPIPPPRQYSVSGKWKIGEDE